MGPPSLTAQVLEVRYLKGGPGRLLPLTYLGTLEVLYYSEWQNLYSSKILVLRRPVEFWVK